jgi:tripartite-type tricarboxylate transporter receptor subunit TctC
MSRVLSGLVLGPLLVALVVGCAQTVPSAAPGAPPVRAGRPAGAAAAPAAAPGAPTGARLEYFTGKTLTVLVNFTAGGPTDIFARMVAQYLDRHIPGNPTVVVENKPGAGGVIGANYLYNVARKDGLTLGIFSSPFAAQVIQGEGVQYDSAEFQWVGGVSESQVTYARTSLGIKTPRDLLSPSQEMIVGGLSADSAKDLRMRTFLNLLGAKYRYVTGYPGQADVVLAFRRGEVNVGDDSLTSWITNVVPLVKEGEAAPIAQQGIVKNGRVVRDPRVADIPTYFEIVEQLKGDAATQTVDYRAMSALIELGSVLRALVYPPGTDPVLVQVMRKAVADTFADPEFQAAAEKQLGFQFEFVPGVAAQTLAEKIIQGTNEDPEPIDHLRQLAKTGR